LGGEISGKFRVPSGIIGFVQHLIIGVAFTGSKKLQLLPEPCLNFF
jgi:hypothetical protein